MSTQSFLHPSGAEGKKVSSGVSVILRQLSVVFLIISCGLFPILFIPSGFVSLGAGKTALLMGAVSLSIIFYIFSILKDGIFSFRLPLPIIGLWIISGISILSAVFSGDFRDSFFGNNLEVYTALFSVIVAIVASAMGIFSKGKSILNLYIVMIGSGIILSLFHIVRLLAGPETLSFGLWNSATFSPFGGWNALAIFYGLVILLSVLALRQLSLTTVGKYLILGGVGLSLLMLSVINFTTIWWVLGIVGLLSLSNIVFGSFWKKTNTKEGGVNFREYTIAVIAVLVFSMLFIVAGNRIGGFINNQLGVAFIEVRPSAAATLSLGKEVFSTNPLLGFGSNRFTDAWRQHKDISINQTVFWNSQFEAGYSYVFTSIINTGLLGLLSWFFFFGAFLLYGYRFLINDTKTDNLWQFIGLSSFVSSAYFWLISIVYTSPSTVVILAAITTGIFMVAYTKTIPGQIFNLSSEKNRISGFILVGLSIFAIVGLVYGMFVVVKQNYAVYEFNKAVSTIKEGDTLVVIEAKIAKAFDAFPNDVFAREIAFYRWSEMRGLLGVQEPTTEQQQAFSDSVTRAIQAGQLAVNLDPTDPYNHQLLGQIYSVLAIVGVEGASEKAIESYENAKILDPQNPMFDLLKADLEIQLGNKDSARISAENAVVLKPNYTEALFFLAQMDINEGNLDRAISIVTGVAQLEPQNPARRYQLGILLASSNRLDESISAFEQAVVLDPQYANARYFLALGYAEKGLNDKAIEQLNIVKQLNSSNNVVDEIIKQLETTGSVSTDLSSQSMIDERDSESGNVTNRDLESDLVTSSNPLQQEETVILE